MQPNWRPPSPAQPFYGHPQAQSNLDPIGNSSIAPFAIRTQPTQQPLAGPSSWNDAFNAVPTKRTRDDQQSDEGSRRGEPAKAGPKSEKSCKACRQRKVKCSRTWPRCERCSERDLECDFGVLVPVEFVSDMLEGHRLSSLEQRIHSLEATRHRLGHLPLASELAETVTSAYLSGTRVGAEMERSESDYAEQELVHACSSQGMLDQADFEEVYGADGLSWKLLKTALARSLTVHLVRSFFASCCSHMPTFKPWHGRVNELCGNVDDLDPATRTAIFVFSSLGARASPHSALLNVEGSPSSASSSSAYAGPSSAGAKREHACRALVERAVEYSHRFGLEDDSTIQNLEIIMLLLQHQAWNELIPRRSRTLVRLALGHFTDIQDDPNLDEQLKADTVKRLGLPLAAADAMVAAYARKPPLVTRALVTHYFGGLSLPDLKTANLAKMVTRFVELDRPSAIVHERIGAATAMLFVWLISCQREVARLSAIKECDQSEIRTLWARLDELHSCAQKLQDIVMHLEHPPAGCADMDGVHDLHMRFATRTDREAIDVTLLLHSLIGERQATTPNERALREDSFARVRRALKLAAFYFELYITSSDPHQAYHLAFELELLPDWVEMALQRYGEPGGPTTEDLELSETELDWLERGLGVTTFYHVLAERRLGELLMRRRPQREGTHCSTAGQGMSTLRFNPAMKAVIAAADMNSAWPTARLVKREERHELGLPSLSSVG